MPKINYFPIKNFRGVESKIDPRDAGRGGLIRAEGMLIAPWWSISSGPHWQEAFEQGALGTALEAAMNTAGLANDKVHFATVASGDTVLLVAWDRSIQRALGLWHVGGAVNPPVWSSASTIAVNVNAAWNNYTVGARWYSRWVGQTLRLGNGAENNLIWKAGGLSVLGPATPPTDPYDSSQVRIPPCFCFARNATGSVFAAGNATYPLRVFITEPPNKDYPDNEGIKNIDSSFVDVALPAGTAITALQETNDGIVAHTTRGVVLLSNFEGVADGWNCAQRVLNIQAGAINPLCAQNDGGNPFFIGQDYELYRKSGGELATAKSTSFWNRAALKAAVTTADKMPMMLYDRRSQRAWLGLPVIEDGSTGWWVWDEHNDAITGPIRYPDFTAATVLRYETTSNCWAVGITRGGALVYTDLNLTDEPELAAPCTPLNAKYLPKLEAPTDNDAGIPYVGINDTGDKWAFVREGSTLYFDGPWADQWKSTGDAPTRWFKNAYVGIVEFFEEDFGDPATRRNYIEARLQWRRNQIAYCGVFCESDGVRDGQWIGQTWPNTLQLAHINLLGVRLRIRIICVFFNDSRAILPDLSVGYLPSKAW